jgi:precorrin-6B methylase 2
LTNLNQQLHIINMASATVQTSYGHCDTFFVEGYEDTDGIFARAAAERERARAIAKVQQRHMAANLSRQTSELYLNDVLDHMEVMEVRSSGSSSI